MTRIVRPMIEQDLTIVCNIIVRGLRESMVGSHSARVIEKFSSSISTEHLRSQLIWPNKVTLVVEEASSVIATGSLVDFGNSEKPKWCVSMTFVIPERQSQGVGRLLLQSILAIAKEKGISYLHVPSSRNAVRFYSNFGFHIDAQQGDIEDEITWMTYPLN